MPGIQVWLKFKQLFFIKGSINDCFFSYLKYFIIKHVIDITIFKGDRTLTGFFAKNSMPCSSLILTR